MEARDINTKPSNREIMEIELRPWQPRFPKLSIWLYAKPYGFHLSAVYYVALTCLLILLGVVVSLLLHDGLWLSRSGALIIVVSVLFGVHGLEGKIGSDIRYCNEILKAIEDDDFARRKDAFGGSFKKNPDDIKDIFLHSFSQAFAGKREKDWGDRVVRNTVRIGAGIAIVGTLVWGFGDLLLSPSQTSPDSNTRNTQARVSPEESVPMTVYLIRAPAKNQIA
ncbi:hypothetical protein [Lamprocystis purpurea]|jgi:hypothetical protein|uniref:hypothetical protein n=1 Tax=Lamprocystis purpurea TaxID=61598 RepID=UPI0012F8EF3C|nr:hypothetical protein [Lamprocystis purpurea]